jgi:peptidyl-prolyl cis-trans isomerase D
MITAIRRTVTSKIGAFFALTLLVILGIMFLLGDVNIVAPNASVSSGHVMAVGERQLTSADLRSRIKLAYDRAAQQQPGLTMAQFLAGDTFDKLVEESADYYALEQYARSRGIGIDKLFIDAAIARNPAFAGLNGSFDQTVYERRIGEVGLTDERLRRDMENDAIVRQLVQPIGAVPQIPQGMATTYASLLLEQREGQAAFIPASAYAPTAAPTDAQLTAFFTSQRARYSIPERRVIRYAILDESALPAVPAPTAAEIQAEFTANAAQYAAQETRRFSQVIAGSRAVADRIAAGVRGGQSLSAAATAAGLSASPVTATSEAEFAGQTNATVARAAFAATQGATVGPQQVPLGFVVLKVEEINRRPARSLAEVTPELTRIVAERKRQEAMVDLYNTVQNSLNSGASVAEVARDKGLQVVTTPAILPNGAAPDNAAFRPDAILAPLIGPAFAGHEGDAGQLIQIEENRRFALVEVAQAVPAAPPPLASIRDQVVADWRRSEGAKVARAKARQILAAVERGQSLAAATAAAGVSTSVQTIGGRRINLNQTGQRVPPEITMLFSMPQGSTKTLELPGGAGWMVLHMARSIRGNAAEAPDLIQSVQQQFRDPLGGELVESIVAAARAAFPVTLDREGLATLRAEMTGTTAEAN